MSDDEPGVDDTTPAGEQVCSDSVVGYCVVICHLFVVAAATSFLCLPTSPFQSSVHCEYRKVSE